MKLAMTLRLETGRDLLGTSSLSVTEIAYALDFSSSAHFTTLFRKHFDETPSNARKRLRQSEKG
jgi:transcriptional regulator GlxA family with amidase domain